MLKNSSLKSCDQKKKHRMYHLLNVFFVFLFAKSLISCHVLLKSCLQVVRYSFLLLNPVWIPLTGVMKTGPLLPPGWPATHGPRSAHEAVSAPFYPTEQRSGSGSSRSSISNSIRHVKCVHGMSKHTGTSSVEMTGQETLMFWPQPWVEIKRLYWDWMCTYLST